MTSLAAMDPNAAHQAWVARWEAAEAAAQQQDCWCDARVTCPAHDEEEAA